MVTVRAFSREIVKFKGFFGVRRRGIEFRISAANFLRDVRYFALMSAIELEGMDNGRYVERYNIFKKGILSNILADCVTNYYSSNTLFDVTRDSPLGKKIVDSAHGQYDN